jgi:hypothetical protein
MVLEKHDVSLELPDGDQAREVTECKAGMRAHLHIDEGRLICRTEGGTVLGFIPSSLSDALRGRPLVGVVRSIRRSAPDGLVTQMLVRFTPEAKFSLDAGALACLWPATHCRVLCPAPQFPDAGGLFLLPLQAGIHRQRTRRMA